MSVQIISRSIKILSTSNIFLKHCAIPICNCQQSLSTKSANLLSADDQITGEQKKKKTSIIPKITLINGQQLTITTLDEAQKLSKRRDLKLVKIVDLDTKTQRPVYKLMTGSEYFAEDLKQREIKKKEREASTIKGEKLLMLKSNITEHDLMTDVRKINKWIAKSYEIRVIINGNVNNMENADKVYNFLENSLKTVGRFVQRRQKGSDIKFQIIPPKKVDNDNTNSQANSDTNNL